MTPASALSLRRAQVKNDRFHAENDGFMLEMMDFMLELMDGFILKIRSMLQRGQSSWV